MRILLTGGGTGGHIYPLVAVANKIKQIYQEQGKDQDLKLYFLGIGGLAEKELINHGIKTKTIFTGKLRRYFSIHNFIDILKLPIGLVQCFWHLFFIMPDVIFSKGGFDSVPVVIVGWIYRIPIIIHESDSIPGLANRISAKFAKRIGLAFKTAISFFKEEKTALLGNPIREKIVRVCLSQEASEKKKAKQFFQISDLERPIILVLGGSQGAKKINDLILKSLYDLLNEYEVIHQCGVKNEEQIKKIFEDKLPEHYHVFPFLKEQEMAYAYLSADLIISRAGAGSIFEISACGKPSIIIPLPKSAGNHQRENAFSFARYGAAVVMEQDNLTPHLLLHEIKKILEHSEQRISMSENAKNFSILESSKYIAEEIIKLAIKK